MMRYMIRCKCFLTVMAAVILFTGLSTGWTSEGIFLPWENTCEDSEPQTAVCKWTEDQLQMMPVNRTQEKNQKRNEYAWRPFLVEKTALALDKNNVGRKYPITQSIFHEGNSVFIQKYIHEQDGEKA